jgi:hypothetical protein
MGRILICDGCHDEFDSDELIPESEPHGETLHWSPCCHEGWMEEDEYDPTPYETPEGGNFAEERYREAARQKRELG